MGGLVIDRSVTSLVYLCRMLKKGFIMVVVLLVFTQCNTTRQNADIARKDIPADLLGDFKDDYDIRYSISEKRWVQHPNAVYHLLRYDSVGQFFIARNDSKNPSDPGLYTRIDIMRFNNMEPWRWGFCLTKYNAKSLEEALSATAADRSNPKKGCGGYPFSRMKRD